MIDLLEDVLYELRSIKPQSESENQYANLISKLEFEISELKIKQRLGEKII